MLCGEGIVSSFGKVRNPFIEAFRELILASNRLNTLWQFCTVYHLIFMLSSNARQVCMSLSALALAYLPNWQANAIIRPDIHAADNRPGRNMDCPCFLCALRPEMMPREARMQTCRPCWNSGVDWSKERRGRFTKRSSR